ncbi:MAG: hypothetical protein HY423_11975 [Candidatus Lambdaproteobacteria bacterium]|nr:hypothetical protein [Candidatus Lambdaproteobacteria bacterium]
MICYLCKSAIPDGQPFYNDHGAQVCKPCFKDAPRCWVCRFPGKELRMVDGLGLECEFCRGRVIDDSTPLEPLVEPILPYLAGFGIVPPPGLAYRRIDRLELRERQTRADLPPEEFLDDFLRFCYPLFHDSGQVYLLRRIPRPLFIVHAIVQLAAATFAQAYGLPHLADRTPFHSYARGWCHWLGYEAAQRLNYDRERRQLRRWPELGAQGEFERWEKMARFQPPPKMIAFFQANLQALARKHLTPGAAEPPASAGR